MLHIGQFSDTFLPIVDGVGRVVFSYAETLARKGHECYVVAPMDDPGYLGSQPFELVEFISIEVPTQRQYSSGVPRLDPHYEARMSRIPLDVIHVHSPFIAGREALRQGRRRGIPVVGTFHSRYYDDFYKLTHAEMLANIGVRFIVDFYSRCDQVWAVSQSSAETLLDYGYQGDIAVMPNGTPNVTPLPEDLALARETFHLPEENVLLYCGQINWKKNIRCTLEACAALQSAGRPFTLVLAGQGPDARAIKETAEALGIGQQTVFTGHITNEHLLYGLYQAADLFVFPSLYDTSGMVVREAAAVGTPSVVVRGSAAAEAITDGVNGYLCEDSPASLMNVIAAALGDCPRRAAMGKEAQRTIYLPWDTIVDRALARYESLVAASPRKPRQEP